MHIRSLDLSQILMQHLCHRRAGDISTLLRQAAVSQIAARMLTISHIDVRNDIDDAAVSLLRKALVLAAVAGLHVEDRNM